MVVAEPGVYFYVGSSRKPCTVLTRVARHLARTKPLHWHIDWLTASRGVRVSGVVLVRANTDNCESKLAKLLVEAGLSYVPGFGSTDKPGNVSHLFKCSERSFADCTRIVYELAEKLLELEDLVYVDTSAEQD